jgi:hypothetical protein
VLLLKFNVCLCREDPDPGMNNPDHISESLESIFCVKILKFFDADSGFRIEKIRIWDGKNWDPRSE